MKNLKLRRLKKFNSHIHFTFLILFLFSCLPSIDRSPLEIARLLQSLNVLSTGNVPTISYSESTFTFNQNTAITTITPSLGGNAPSSCSSTPTLPPGLVIDNESCAISGTPIASQVATDHTITDTNGFGSGTANINITVNATANTWISSTPADNIGWASVTFGNGLFVAVASGGIGNRVMTSSE